MMNSGTILKRKVDAPEVCTVCASKNPQFRCCKCFSKYCSRECFHAHLLLCGPHDDMECSLSTGDDKKEAKVCCQDDGIAGRTCSPERISKRANRFEGLSRVFSGNNSALESVSPEKLAEVGKNATVIELLKSSALREIIRTLQEENSDENKLFEKAAADPLFRAFSAIVLEIVGLTEKQKD